MRAGLLFIHHSSFRTPHFVSASRRERVLEGFAVALRVRGFELYVARAARGVYLELEESVARRERLAPGAAHGVAGLRAPAHEVYLAGHVLNLHVREPDRVARPALADDDELLRLAPVRSLARLRHRQHAPEVVALAQVVNGELVRLKLVALDEHPRGDEE